MKIAQLGHLCESVDPSSMNRHVNSKDLSVLDDVLRLYFRPDQHRLREATTCLCTNVPDKDFIVDRHPHFPQVLSCILGGCVM